MIDYTHYRNNSGPDETKNGMTATIWLAEYRDGANVRGSGAQ